MLVGLDRAVRESLEDLPGACQIRRLGEGDLDPRAARLILQLGCGALRDRLAVVDDQDVVGQPIRLSPADTTSTVAGDGTISSENGQLGRIGVVQPDDPRKLNAEGDTLLRADAPTAQAAQARVVQGAVEDSNVQPVTQITRMLDEYRRFQYLGQFLQAESDRQNNAIEKL